MQYFFYVSSDETSSVDSARPMDNTEDATSKPNRKRSKNFDCYLTTSKINARQNKGMLLTDFLTYM